MRILALRRYNDHRVKTPRQVAPETVFDAIPFPALVVDRDVRVLEYNLSAAGMSGNGTRRTTGRASRSIS